MLKQDLPKWKVFAKKYFNYLSGSSAALECNYESGTEQIYSGTQDSYNLHGGTINMVNDFRRLQVVCYLYLSLT